MLLVSNARGAEIGRLLQQTKHTAHTCSMMETAQHTSADYETTQIIEHMSSAIDYSLQYASAAATAAAIATAAAALEVLATQPQADQGQRRCTYECLCTSVYHRNSHYMVLLCPVYAAV